MKKNIKVFLITDNEANLNLMKGYFSEIKNLKVSCKSESSPEKSLKEIASESYDLIIMELKISSSEGINSLSKVHIEFEDIPIIVITDVEDEKTGIKVISLGAQDYLIKSDLNARFIEKSIIHAIERHKMVQKIRSLSLVDELTGLYNRRGFLAFGRQQLKNCIREKKRAMLIFADMDGLKKINDLFGHQFGDQALYETGNILRNVMRESDIVARIGGDEFAVLVVESDLESNELILKRIKGGFFNYNLDRPLAQNLSISFGVSFFDYEKPSTVTELLFKADRLMYAEKSKKAK